MKKKDVKNSSFYVKNIALNSSNTYDFKRPVNRDFLKKALIILITV